MKEIKTDKVFEKKIRIYEIHRLEELDKFYQEHKKEYKNINEYLVSLIFKGLESEKLFEQDAKTYFLKSQGLNENIVDMTKVLQAIKQTQTNEYKDMVKLAYELRLMLFRIYNAMFDLANRNDLKDYYDNGYKDDEPEDLQLQRDLITSQVDAEFGKDIKII